MDPPTPTTPNADSGSTVDTTRPFRSVKEAVAIFGERLFLGEAKSSRISPGFSTGKENLYISEVPQSTNRPSSANSHSSMDGEEEVDPSSDEQPHSAELTSPKGLQDNSSEREVDLSLPNPSNPFQLRQSPHELSYASEITESPLKSPVISFNQVVKSPMYELTPSPQNFRNENHGNIVHGNDLVMMLMVLKKLEAELQETKMELKLLKERESETEVALASLNAELHKNMSKMAKAEAVAAGNAASKSITNDGLNREMGPKNEERVTGDMMMKTIDSPTLAQILSISDYEGYFGGSRTRTKKLMKKKPIIPLVTDIFQWRKKPSPTHDISSPLLSS